MTLKSKQASPVTGGIMPYLRGRHQPAAAVAAVAVAAAADATTPDRGRVAQEVTAQLADELCGGL